MSIAIICTIGSRDVLFDGEPIKPARTQGAKLFEEFDTNYKKFTFPIIQPTLDYVLERNDLIDRLILVATDQNEAEERFRENDTIEFAKIIQRSLEKRYGGRKICEIRIIRIPERPHLLDDMYTFFGETIQCNKAFRFEDLDVCYVQQTGGIPSANMALLFQCINRFQQKCFPLYVSEKTKSVVPLQIGQQILEEYRRKTLLAMIEHYEFRAIVEQLTPLGAQEQCLWRLANYAEARLSFDIKGAVFHATEGMGESFGQDRTLFEDLLLDLNELRKRRSPEARIRELFWNMQVKWERGEYVDLLARLYRLKEAVLRYIVEKDLRISTNIDQKTRKYQTFEQGVQNYPALKAFLEQQKAPNGQPLDYSTVDVPVLMACLRFLTQSMPSYADVHDILQGFEPLINLRNRSIIGHGFEGVSKDIVGKVYEGDLLEDLRTLLVRIGLNVSEGPFVQLRRELRRRVEKL